MVVQLVVHALYPKNSIPFELACKYTLVLEPFVDSFVAIESEVMTLVVVEVEEVVAVVGVVGVAVLQKEAVGELEEQAVVVLEMVKLEVEEEEEEEEEVAVEGDVASSEEDSQIVVHEVVLNYNVIY